MEEAILLGSELDRHHAHRRSIHKRDHSAANNPAWFGPRLGRKKRSISSDDEILEILDERNRDEDLQLLKNYPWALIVSDGKRNNKFGRSKFA